MLDGEKVRRLWKGKRDLPGSEKLDGFSGPLCQDSLLPNLDFKLC